MDKLSLIGIILGLGAIIGGQALEGGNVGSLIQFTAFVIVIGGTSGAVLLQSSSKSFWLGIKIFWWVFFPPKTNMEDWLKAIVHWSLTARRSGLLGLEGIAHSQRDAFVSRGLQMLVDGSEPDSIRYMMEIEITIYEEIYRAGAKIWESAGGYAPTIGILGAVMGLIHVMENLTDPSKLGAGIAVAFVATIYGVGSANLVFLPIANKLKYTINNEIKRREMLTEGISAIALGENPRNIENKLKSFLH